MSLEQNTDLIREKTAGAADLNKKVKFDLKEDGIIHVDATTSPPTVSNDDNDADVTLILSMENFEALVDGSLNPQMAFMMGKLKIEGDMGLALKLADIF
ncbi:MAG: SCP2 sterol-binding domain-containing protein [Kordiimonadaceae bacterium]|jgi:putative sterol carrier protein|nr:SCP2 sterol-binding domain-containing protein [Kordiimonadaceae bacterium]MBT6036141.1 SCP2 sterol-binding domain-containing protein [Kordiimonadaceae bacterium]MBT6329092.1 SCP2 sterol-binding domain-containing protein [Kordiimonadaceae bacterium]MBT7583536.1 SCP2 sterol-binding domain-containing protein [Kordiimonadaceae bacterium]